MWEHRNSLSYRSKIGGHAHAYVLSYGSDRNELPACPLESAFSCSRVYGHSLKGWWLDYPLIVQYTIPKAKNPTPFMSLPFIVGFPGKVDPAYVQSQCLKINVLSGYICYWRCCSRGTENPIRSYSLLDLLRPASCQPLYDCSLRFRIVFVYVSLSMFVSMSPVTRYECADSLAFH